MSKRKSTADVPVPTSSYVVEGRIFRTRPEAIEYCKANRIPAWKIGLCPTRDELDPIKLSTAPGWRMRSFFDGPAPMLVFEHEATAHAFSVSMSDLTDLVSAVKARIRELAKVSS